jgi:hypothetical protein
MKSRTMLCNFYKELSIPVFGEEKSQNQRTIGSGYYKNLKELVGVFLKEPEVNLWLYGQSSERACGLGYVL